MTTTSSDRPAAAPGSRVDIEEKLLGGTSYKSLGEQRLSEGEERFERRRRNVGFVLAPIVGVLLYFLPLANLTSVPLAGAATRLGARVLAGSKAARSVLAGSADDTAARIREYVDAGATSVIITTRPGLNHDLMRRFAAEVVPRFRAPAKEG